MCSHAYCILLWLGGDAARSEQLCHPRHFAPGSAFPGLDSSALALSLVGLTVVIFTPRELLPPTIYLTSLMMLLVVTPITGFILPLQSPLLFQVSAVISLDSDCPALASFVFLVMASHYQCCA